MFYVDLSQCFCFVCQCAQFYVDHFCFNDILKNFMISDLYLWKVLEYNKSAYKTYLLD